MTQDEPLDSRVVAVNKLFLRARPHSGARGWTPGTTGAILFLTRASRAPAAGFKRASKDPQVSTLHTGAGNHKPQRRRQMAKKTLTRDQKRRQKLKKRATGSRAGGGSDTCRVCGREKTPEPMDPLMAAMGRVEMTKTLGAERGDMLSYMHAKSTVLVSSMNMDQFCECDIANWNAAQVEYETKGADACWAALGVTVHVMNHADAARIHGLVEERRTLSDEDKERLIELEAYFREHGDKTIDGRELRGGDGIFAHRPKSPPRDPNRPRATRVITNDDDPLFPYEEYIEAKYEGENPNEIYECLAALEQHGLEKAAEVTGKSQEWLEKWGHRYGAEHLLRDTDWCDPYARALNELAKLHPEDFRDLWEDEERAQPELEAHPIGRQNMLLSGIPFLRGRAETPELAADREVSRRIRAVRRDRPLRVIK